MGKALFWIIANLISIGVWSQSEIKGILSHPSLKHASVSISLVDMQDGKSVYTYDPDRSLIPASTLKLLTGIPALKELGVDFRFTTEIAYTGQINADGSLSGDLYLIGGYDPTLGSNRIKGSPDRDKLIELIVEKVSQTISCIDGNIIVDISAGKGQFPIAQDWLYEDVGNYYGSGAWPINIGENIYTLYFDRSGKIGSKTSIQRVEPRVPQLEHENLVTVDAKGSGDNAYILGGPYQYQRSISGTLPQGQRNYKIKGALPDPPVFMAYSLYHAFKNKGISSAGYQVSDKTQKPSLKNISTIKSPRLLDIVQVIHLESNNLYTEAVHKRMGLANGKLPVLGAGSKIVDASGLSPLNRMSSYQMASFLQSQGVPGQVLLSTLPQAGLTGTLKYMFTQSPAKGHIYAKSGSMSGVLCYAGYIQAANGKWYAFAVMLNHFDVKIREMKPLAEAIMEALYQGRF